MAGLLGGVLPAIYSGADQLKRQIYGLLTNPNEMAQRAGQNLLQTHAENQALMSKAHGNPQNPLQITDPTAFSELTNRYMAGVTGIAPIGMIAYHGTPHTIQGKFDISKVGTGEGAQSYGHGMYFAEARPVAEEYAGMAHKSYFDQSKSVEQLASQYWDMYKTPDKAIQALKNEIKPNLTPEAKKFTEDAISILEGKKGNVGNLYKVDIPDEYIPKMLDWDKPLLEQTPQVQEALAKLGIKSDKQKLKEFDNALLESLFSDTSKALPKQPINPTGESIYQTIIQGNPKYTAEKLKEAGITGIRYLDQGSRNVDMPDIAFYEQGVQKMKDIFNANPTEANKFALDDAMQKLESVKRGMKDITSNFVVFDPTDVKILERNDKPLEGLLGK